MFTKESKYYDQFHKNKDYKQEARGLRRRFIKANTVLEVGCGTGNLSEPLEKLGFEVTGIDTSKEMLKRYKGKTGIETSIQDYHIQGKYDLVLAMYDVLNYIPFDEIDDVLKKLKKLGGKVLIETWPVGKVKMLTYKRSSMSRRVRLGFKFMNRAYLWYIFWGRGLVVSHHKLYLHRCIK